MRTTAILAALFLSVPSLALPARGQEMSGPSGSTALAWSLGATLAPVAVGAVLWSAQGDEILPGGVHRAPERVGPAMLMADGVVLGPAIGYWYGGRTGRGLAGVGIRTGLMAVSFVPAMAICGWDCTAGDSGYDVAWLMVAAGSGLGVASAVWDILHVRGAVEAGSARPRGVSIRVSPAWMGADRGVGVGVSIRW